MKTLIKQIITEYLKLCAGGVKLSLDEKVEIIANKLRKPKKENDFRERGF
jgi:hypothetical protein